MAEEPCKKCREGYKLENNICKDVSEGCAEVRPQDGICSKCKKGFIQVGFSCISKKIKVPRCYIYNAEGKCKVCKNGFNMFEDWCLLSKEIQNYMLAKEAGTADTFGFTAEGFVINGKTTSSI